jgi:hypothetical protein
MAEYASEQERIIHEFSQRVLGQQALFLPDKYGHSKQPADIAWISNRCAILMYMTKSEKPYERKRDHNLGQLNRWLRVWQNGQPLTGTVDNRKYQFAFNDIDYVVGLSIVDGGEVWCEYHAERVTHRTDGKLAACATITGRVMREFAAAGVGPRDIMVWLNTLRMQPTRLIREELMIASIRHYVRTTRIQVEASLANYNTWDFAFRDDSIREMEALFRCSKSLESSIFSDLLLSDVTWLGTATAALERQLAAPGQHGILCVTAVNDTGIYRLRCVVAARLKYLPPPAPPPAAGFDIYTTFDLGFPTRSIAIVLRTVPSHLEQELRSLRQLTIAGYNDIDRTLPISETP